MWIITLQSCLFTETLPKRSQTIKLDYRWSLTRCVQPKRGSSNEWAKPCTWITTHKCLVTWHCRLLTSMVTSACLRLESWRDLPSVDSSSLTNSEQQGKVLIHPQAIHWLTTVPIVENLLLQTRKKIRSNWLIKILSNTPLYAESSTGKQKVTDLQTREWSDLGGWWPSF